MKLVEKGMHLPNIMLPNITFGEMESEIQIKDLTDVEWEVPKQQQQKKQNVDLKIKLLLQQIFGTKFLYFVLNLVKWCIEHNILRHT